VPKFSQSGFPVERANEPSLILKFNRRWSCGYRKCWAAEPGIGPPVRSQRNRPADAP
jgi:hypothetical protein